MRDHMARQTDAGADATALPARDDINHDPATSVDRAPEFLNIVAVAGANGSKSIQELVFGSGGVDGRADYLLNFNALKSIPKVFSAVMRPPFQTGSAPKPARLI